MSPADRTRRAGFTLLEGVVAITVLGAVSVAALGAMSANLRSTARAERALTGMALAEDRLTTLRMLPRSELVPLSDSLRGGRFPPPLDDYRWTTDASRSRTESSLVRVRITVEWDGGSETLETLTPGHGR